MKGSELFFSADALLDRLTDGVVRSKRPVIFLVGSALTSPSGRGEAGVPGVAEVVEMIRSEFAGDRLADLDSQLAEAMNRYQVAFSFLLARRGQNVVNDIVKRAVWQARKRALPGAAQDYKATFSTDDDLCKVFDQDTASWELTPAVRALGELVTAGVDEFGSAILTTNFDPLIEVSIKANNGTFYRTVVHRDGNLDQTAAAGCHVVHLHGYWYGGDTLHTPRQLTQERPRLRASLAHLLHSKTLVVLGYGGWDDVFTRTLLDLIQDDRENFEILWAFYGAGSDVDPRLLEALSPGIDRGVINLYENIDCHSFLPNLRKFWASSPAIPQADDLESEIEKAIELSSIVPATPYKIGIHHKAKDLDFEFRHQDRPPLIEFYVGREKEAKALDESDAKIVYLTGIGGEGKSALAGDYLSRHRSDGTYDYVIWRDCKEEAERFESQITSIVYAMMKGEVELSELSKLQVDNIIELFIELAARLKLLLVFDNVDHYVDLESNRLTGVADLFAKRIGDSSIPCRVIFTCRPSIMGNLKESIEVRLQGIDLDAAKELFYLRQVSAPEDEIKKAHEITGGHAFWLDLIAAQLARNPGSSSLEEFLQDIPSGGVGLPVETLMSIWNNLKDREHIVLRGLAEAVRPITAYQLSDFISGHLKWNQTAKALKYLRSLNLIVVKLQDAQTEVLELHPLVRAFVRNNFKPSQQKSFIDSFMKAYLAFFGLHRSELTKGPRPETVDRWLEAAEVCTQSERFEQAFEWLNDVTTHVQSTGNLSEYIRVADVLVRSRQWREGKLPAHFDDVMSFLIESVSAMGRQSQTMFLLEKYKETIPHKNARYINYCDLMCQNYWISGDYLSAIKWGVEGVQLKSTSDVDTVFDARHNLALAQRDSGAVDEALRYFLKGAKLETILAEGDEKARLGGAYYGNIGRCLHISGQINSTLICYKKSARIIEKERAQTSVANKGYIRQWVGEVMYSKGDRRLASACFSAALGCWELVAPPKAEAIHRRLTGLDGYAGLSLIGSAVAERAFLAWTWDEALEVTSSTASIT